MTSDPQPQSGDIVDISSAKARLVQVAMKLFAEHGFDGVSVRDIAAAGSVSVGLINHHFQSKEGLREAVDQHFMAQFTEMLDQYPQLHATDGLEQLVMATESWISRHVAEWDVSRAYLRRALLEGSDWGFRIFERFYQFNRTSMDQADARGGLRPDIDRLWLPFLMLYLEVGTLLLEPYVDRLLGQSGFDRALWLRRHRAYTSLVYGGVGAGKN